MAAWAVSRSNVAHWNASRRYSRAPCTVGSSSCDNELSGFPLMSSTIASKCIASYDSHTLLGRKCKDECKCPRTLPTKEANQLQVLEWVAPGLPVVQELEFYDFIVVLDSGAADPVVAGSEAPGYEVCEGVWSKVGGCFVAGNKQHIPNKGMMTLELHWETQLFLPGSRWPRSPGYCGAQGNMRCGV